MKYIAYRNFNDAAISGKVNILRGEELTLDNEILYYDNKPICAVGSYNGTRHFAKNDDGNGLERGDLIYAIVYADRQKTWTSEITYINEDGEKVTDVIKHSERFTPDEIELIEKQYPQFDKDPEGRALIFGNEFFTADIEVLRELANKLNIEI